MSKVLMIIVTINVAIVCTIAGTLLLAKLAPFHPGEIFYPVQNVAEQLSLRMTPGEERKATRAFETAERRLADLPHCESDEMTYCLMIFGDALQTASGYIQALPDNHDMHTSLYQFLQQANAIIAGLEDQYSATATKANIIDLIESVASLHSRLAANSVIRVSRNQTNTLQKAVPVPFIGEQDFDHGIYPLFGTHAETQCESCHDKGLYTTTPSACLDCHELPLSAIYTNHFEGECTDCHDQNAWNPIAFEHIGVLECKSCHIDDTPGGHSVYIFRDEDLAVSLQRIDTPTLVRNISGDDRHSERPCMSCHVDVAYWNEVIFDHEDGFLDCAMCHTNQVPEQHYDGQCSRCHNTTAWDQATFDHTNYPDCLSCHQPGHKYDSIPCTDCHQDTDNWHSLNYNHVDATDCTYCHTGDTPSEHYAGQCSNCHDTSAWQPAWFNHAGFMNCSSCHTKYGHFDGIQCSTCHSTNTWIFDHYYSANCILCHAPPEGHFPGQCANCHKRSRWSECTYEHIGAMDCASCHPVPGKHYAGQCSSCHTTASWSDYTFSHVGFDECAGCHAAPNTHVYYEPCSICHNTSNWSQISLDHNLVSDCTHCHIRPSDHDNALCCCNCHSPTNWTDVRFSHDAVSDCVSCHPAPAGHWPGLCSDCHNTSHWSDYTFSHEGYDNCKACHAEIRPGDHPNEQCSNCHTTETWGVVSTNTPPPTATPTPVPTLTPTPTNTPMPTPVPVEP